MPAAKAALRGGAPRVAFEFADLAPEQRQVPGVGASLQPKMKQDTLFNTNTNRNPNFPTNHMRRQFGAGI